MRFARIIAATACIFALLPAAPARSATRNVGIPGRFFQPQRLTVNVGDTVVWTNTSNERHSVRATSDSAESFQSSNSCPGGLLGNDCIRSGARYSHTFESRGAFAYYCERHGTDAVFPNCGMCGRISVVRKSSGTVSPTATPSASTSPTPTATSPSPSPDESASPSPGAIQTSPIASEGGIDETTSILAIATTAVVLLGGSGYLIYRTMIRR